MRKAISIALGIVVFFLTYLFAWLILRDHPYVQGFWIAPTKHDLIEIRGQLEEFRKETGEYPSSLKALTEREHCFLSVDEFGQPLDFWQNPYVYFTMTRLKG